MAKTIVQVPASEIIKNKQQLESERIELAKQRREIQAAQNRAAGLKTAASMALALGTAGVALYKIAQQGKLHRERIDHEVNMLRATAERAREKEERASQLALATAEENRLRAQENKANELEFLQDKQRFETEKEAKKRKHEEYLAYLRLIGVLGLPTVTSAAAKAAYKFTPESFQKWWTEQDIKYQARSQAGEQQARASANAENIRQVFKDIRGLGGENKADAFFNLAGQTQQLASNTINSPLLQIILSLWLGRNVAGRPR